MAEDISTGASTEEDFSDSFTCSICLDLLYKPIVLCCGHVSCFWCVHRSMNSNCESHCPICRHPYYHFPTISWTLHFLLLKLYPITYKRREEQILEYEKKSGIFSPQFDSNSFSNGNSKQLSVVDVECSSCKQMLFNPVFLNCGHGYCESCIPCPVDEMLKCQVCQSPHPTGLPKICLELHHFFEKQFPREYALRRKSVEQLKKVEMKNENSTSCSTTASKKGFSSVSPSSEIHHCGCDYCGMYPIIGDRYKCQDCVERIGFDLCGDCYNKSSSKKRPGRFNQQHTPEHKFVKISANSICDLINNLQAEHLRSLISNFPRSIRENEPQDENDGSTYLDRG